MSCDSPLVKSFPFLPSHPFEAVYAICTVKAPAQSRYIQYNNDGEQADNKFHYALLYCYDGQIHVLCLFRYTCKRITL